MEYSPRSYGIAVLLLLCWVVVVLLCPSCCCCAVLCCCLQVRVLLLERRDLPQHARVLEIRLDPRGERYEYAGQQYLGGISAVSRRHLGALTHAASGAAATETR